jgi:chemosensory pili system protein ChpA (sensor histidine kinase/response regulator)
VVEVHGWAVPDPTVVVAEDDDSLRRLLERRLLAAGFRVDAVTDGAAALDAVRSARPDVLLTDLEMPAMDGGDLCHQVRADAQLHDLPILLFSGAQDSPVLSRLLRLGRIALVRKTDGWEPLLTTLRRLIADSASATA